MVKIQKKNVQQEERKLDNEAQKNKKTKTKKPRISLGTSLNLNKGMNHLMW